MGVPGNLGIVVSVDVDEPWRHESTLGIEDSTGPCGRSARWNDVGDQCTINDDVGRSGRGTGTVDESGVPDDEVCHAVRLVNSIVQRDFGVSERVEGRR